MFRTGSFVLAFLIVFSAATSAQNASNGSSSQLQTAWGDPDLQGVWDFRTLTPLERPDEFEGKAFLTEEEAAAFEQQTLEERDMDRQVLMPTSIVPTTNFGGILVRRSLRTVGPH